jgi:protein required for attachment to host cells
MTKIPHGAIVFVGDGRKALFLRNDGDEEFPNLDKDFTRQPVDAIEKHLTG